MRAVVLIGLAVIAVSGCAGRDEPTAPAPLPTVDQAGMPGQPPCAPTPVPGPATPPAAPVSTTALGPSAPAPYELAAPANGARPHGVMIVVHGGAWTMTGPAALAQARPEAEAWQAEGWATANVDYRPCGHSLEDVVALYDLIRAKVGDTPICLTGESAGGHLALLVAALRPDVACVIGRAAPTDGPALGDQPATDPVTGAPSQLAPERLEIGMAQAFGQRALRAFSPTTYAGSFRARLLLVAAANDTIVPPAQSDLLADAISEARPSTHVRTLVLPPGPQKWVHGSVSDAGLRELAEAQRELVAPWSDSSEASEHVDGWW